MNISTSIPSMYFRIFVYSAEEEQRKIKIAGPDAQFGTVVVRGIPKKYTSIVTNMNQSAPDSIIVTQGDIRRIKYTAPKRG